jgi:hypothetical protein
MNDFFEARLNALANDVLGVVRSSVETLIADLPTVLGTATQTESQDYKAMALRQAETIREMQFKIAQLESMLNDKQPKPTDAVLGDRHREGR